MGNLIVADLKKAFKAKFVWIGSLVLVIICTVMLFSLFAEKDSANKYMYITMFGKLFMYYGLIVSSIFPFVTAEDFEGGMIRNKIIAGHSRIQIYFSLLISTIAVGLLLFAEELVVLSVYFVSIAGHKEIMDLLSPEFVPFLIVVIIHQCLITSVLAAVSCAISMYTGKKIISLIVCVVMLFGFVGMMTVRLMATETKPIVEIEGKNGEIEIVDNPYYVPDDDPAKKPIVFLDAFNFPLQGSQLPYFWDENGMVAFEELDNHMVNIADKYVERSIPARYWIGSFSVGFIFTLMGIELFKMRDLK